MGCFHALSRDPPRRRHPSFSSPTPKLPTSSSSSAPIAVPGDHLHLSHGIVYLNGVAQNEPYARPVQNDEDPQDAYEPARDDFPANGAHRLTSKSGPRTCPTTSLTATSSSLPARSSPWATTAPTPSTAATGVSCRAKTFLGPPSVQLLVLPDHRRPDGPAAGQSRRACRLLLHNRPARLR